MRRLLAALVSVASAICGLPALHAQDTGQSKSACEEKSKRISADAKIASCTALIQAGDSSGNLAIYYYDRGVAHDLKGEHDAALGDYEEAIRLKPDYADAFNNRGAIYHDKGQHDRAMADYDRAIALDAQDVEARVNRGNAYRETKQFDRATADFDEAVRLKPGYAPAFKGRGELYQDLGLARLAAAMSALALVGLCWRRLASPRP